MTFDFTHVQSELPILTNNFFWCPWNRGLIRNHAKIIHLAFGNDLDGRLFPTYRQYDACESLIKTTIDSKLFVPDATWLLGRLLMIPRKDCVCIPFEYCAAIQCVQQNEKIGMIQNVSVLSQVRSRGLGRALVLKALTTFQQLGMIRVILTVTAVNVKAVRLYTSIGFRVSRCFYTESFVDTNN